MHWENCKNKDNIIVTFTQQSKLSTYLNTFFNELKKNHSKQIVPNLKICHIQKQNDVYEFKLKS